MKRFKITLLVPHSREVVVADAQAAHNEATRLAKANVLPGDHPAIVHSVEFINDIQTEEIDFGPIDAA